MRVAPGHERGAGRRAQRRRMKIVETQTVLCQAIDVWRLDETAKAPDLREAHVIKEKDENVRGVL